MFFGAGDGRIEISLDNTNVKFGDTISGKLILTLKSQKQAKQLSVTLSAELLSAERAVVEVGGIKRYTKNIVLGGERYYPTGIQEYKFQFQVPKKDEVLPQIEKQFLGSAIVIGGKMHPSAENSLRQIYASLRIAWFVSASLEIPGGSDIIKKVQISVSE